jgi:hypothetical protein
MTVSLRLRATLVAVGAIAALTGCSGGPGDAAAELSGCLDGDSGTIIIGVTNTAGTALVVETIELTDSTGVEVIDRFVAIDEDARTTSVRFIDGGRESVGGVDLDRGAIKPGEAAFVGVEVARTGSADGRVGGLVLTVDGANRPAPVTLDLRDRCD